ncbi:hypothetical protein D3C87_1972010 [compost metagenome]
MDGPLRPSLYRKISIHALGIHPKLLTSPLHRVIDTAACIVRDDANMGSNHTASQLGGEVQNPLGLLNLRRICLGILEAVTR